MKTLKFFSALSFALIFALTSSAFAGNIGTKGGKYAHIDPLYTI